MRCGHCEFLRPGPPIGPVEIRGGPLSFASDLPILIVNTVMPKHKKNNNEIKSPQTIWPNTPKIIYVVCTHNNPCICLEVTTKGVQELSVASFTMVSSHVPPYIKKFENRFFNPRILVVFALRLDLGPISYM